VLMPACACIRVCACIDVCARVHACVRMRTVRMRAHSACVRMHVCACACMCAHACRACVTNAGADAEADAHSELAEPGAKVLYIGLDLEHRKLEPCEHCATLCLGASMSTWAPVCMWWICTRESV
jgi:hypothetical protein